jgi:hypothetical protein
MDPADRWLVDMYMADDDRAVWSISVFIFASDFAFASDSRSTDVEQL